MTPKKLKKGPQKLLIIGPDHSPQPKIDFSYYETSGQYICSLICATENGWKLHLKFLATADRPDDWLYLSATIGPNISDLFDLSHHWVLLFSQRYEIKSPPEAFLDRKELRQVGFYDVEKFRLITIDSCALIESHLLFTNVNFATS